MTASEQFAINLSWVKKYEGFTYEEFSDWTGISVSTLRRCESGEFNTTINTAKAVCDALRVTLSQMCETDIQPYWIKKYGKRSGK